MEDPDRDPESEWRIQEYSSKENSGRFRWILNKGVTVGKTILLTGFVISSAPIVLPPLAVVSIIGFACSVPYGLFLASYACTNMLMSKLLPESEPPPYLLEYGTVSEYGGQGDDLGDYGDIDRDKEEEEMWEDSRKSVEMRIELVENEEGEDGQEGFRNNEQELVNGYEEDFGEYVCEDQEEERREEIELKIEGVGEEVQAAVVDIEGVEKSGRAVEGAGTTFEVTIIDFCHDADIEEDEELGRETNGLLEKIREEGMADNGEEQRQSVEKPYGGEEEGDLRVDSPIEEMGMPFEARNYFANVKREKLFREIECKIYENENDETSKEFWEIPETRYAQIVDVLPKEMEPKLMVGDLFAAKESDKFLEAKMRGTADFGFAKNVDEVPKESKPKPLVGDLSTTKESGTTDVGSNLAEEQKAADCKPYMLQNFELNRKKEIVVSSNADARKIADESGFGLFDNKNVAAQPYCYAGERGHDDKGISSQKDISLASSKVFLTEEKIWEKLEAMRTIVGYKSARQATCLEELKALYLFAGVEPSPASSKDSSFLMEVSDKLRFLMAIVGVK